LELLRLVYRDLFYFIGVFSNLDLRVKNLEAKGIKKDKIFKLIDRDSGEEINSGQKVSDSFMQSDFFLRVEKNSRSILNNKLNRFFNLIFNSEIVTPTFHEKAMYLANAAAGNSACLSRQVGASITDSKGEMVSVGWNDVPKSGGGVYEFGEGNLPNPEDLRCMFIEEGKCFNDQEKNIITKELVDVLVEEKLITKNKIEEVTLKIKKSRIKGLIEFSRAVHAEMLAIIYGGRKGGDKLINGKLYCTTYPCHNCARHIVASGIKEVYYIEPYRKSLATKLHWDSISENESDTDKLRILMFDGISPRRYLELFKMDGNKKKESGLMIIKNSKLAAPRKTLSLQAIPVLEKVITKQLIENQLINPES